MLSALDRKAELVRAGKSVRAIAAEVGYTPGHVSQVLHGKRRDAKTEAAIARAIGKTVAQVFGRAA